MRHAVSSTETPDSRTRLTPHHCALSTALDGALSHKNIKSEDRSGYMHENTGKLTKYHAINAAFYTKMHQLHDNRQQSVGLIGRKRTGHAENRGEGGPKIGPSAHQPIGGARSWFQMAR